MRYRIPEVITLPDIKFMYFQPHRASVPLVPDDIQSLLHFGAYNDIAHASCVTRKSQPIDVARAIWFYGVDDGHNSMRYDVQMRYNTVIMAFIAASGFDAQGRGGELLSQLRTPIDPSLPHPRTVRDKHRPPPNENSFFVTKYQIFNESFKVDKSRQQQQGQPQDADIGGGKNNVFVSSTQIFGVGQA
ncbi:hypothetical protein BU25DRAFT_463254 [Macroventuria anomochaeta]|uniref:Uncharacterized protein n=1 Tax=Macroventuria anomochaeta TaxID=301207 RepID=A0ACB6RJQ1_9PLEO|nr:uncharacterized protein BU25DRAFT_463254 [Macroventuria anomochaeta]KAF2621958.1 hypothetical protein BU25DRAFT_463254 [Macroventuria anomochaeta]